MAESRFCGGKTVLIKNKNCTNLKPEDSQKLKANFLQQDDLFALTKPKTEQTLQEKDRKTVKPSTDFAIDLFPLLVTCC